MRHAKSSWSSDARSDHDRPLNGRGKRDAPRIAAALADNGWTPELVVLSTSKRTKQTWKRMADAFDSDDIEVVKTRRFYHGDVDDIRAEAHTWAPEIRTILVLGHNPGWEEALFELTGAEEHFTTGNAALLYGRGDTWVQALSKSWRMWELFRPRELAEQTKG